MVAFNRKDYHLAIMAAVTFTCVRTQILLSQWHVTERAAVDFSRLA